MNRNSTLNLTLSLAILAAGGGLVNAADSGPGPDRAPVPGPDTSELRFQHLMLFLKAWEKGLDIADADRSGKVDGSDMEAFYIALYADVNVDGRLNAADIPAMFDAWVSGGAEGDINQDGGVDGGDIEAFFTALDWFTLPSPEQLSKAILHAQTDQTGSEPDAPAEP